MLVCAFSKASNAHETAGAARTRSSPRPLLRVARALFLLEGANEIECLGQKSCRENERVCVAHPSRRARERAPQDEVPFKFASIGILMVRSAANAARLEPWTRNDESTSAPHTPS